MFDLIKSMIGPELFNGGAHEELVISIAGVLICLFFIIVVDFIRDIFCGFFRG